MGDGVIRRLTLNDTAREKDLIVTVRNPIGRKDAAEKGTDPETGRWHENRQSETFPMVVFSHGLGGAGWMTFPDLADHWASYGYVVVLPTHSDSIALRNERGKEFVNPLRDKAAALAKVDPLERVADVKVILDSIATIEEHVSAWKAAAKERSSKRGDQGGAKEEKPPERIDRDRLAVTGHSTEAFTAQLAIGVKAAIIVSGQGTATAAFTKDLWKELENPILVITGSKDTMNLTKETPESRRRPFEYSRSRGEGGPGVYLLWIKGSTHGSYQRTGVGTGGTPVSQGWEEVWKEG